MIYLDHAATTKVAPEVVKIVDKYMNEIFGNPSSLHKMGLDAEKTVDKSAKIIANVLGCKPSELVFTSGGTESNNTAIVGDFINHPQKIKHYITTKAEHRAVLAPFKYLEKMGQKVTYFPVSSDGLVDKAALLSAVKTDTALISLIYVNNETGAINNIASIVKTLRDAGYDGYIHTDATQAIGKLNVDVKKIGVDFLTASGHKFNAPKGVGLLYVSERVIFKPLLFGGGQQQNRRSGTLNVAGIAGMATALRLKHNALESTYKKAVLLEKRLINGLKMLNVQPIVLAKGAKSPFITALAFPNIKSEVLLHSLESKGIYVSSGSACGSRRNTPISHVIAAMNVASSYRDGVIRVSFDSMTTAEEIDALLNALKQVLPKLIEVIGDRIDR